MLGRVRFYASAALERIFRKAKKIFGRFSWNLTLRVSAGIEIWIRITAYGLRITLFTTRGKAYCQEKKEQGENLHAS